MVNVNNSKKYFITILRRFLNTCLGPSCQDIIKWHIKFDFQTELLLWFQYFKANVSSEDDILFKVFMLNLKWHEARLSLSPIKGIPSWSIIEEVFL